MTKYIVVSDIHSNSKALQRVAFEEGFKENYIVLGDLLGLNGFPSKTVELVKRLGTHVIAGNHDRAIIHENEGHVMSDELSEFELSYTLDNLTPLSMKFMNRLPYFKEINIDGESVALTHANPWPEEASGYDSDVSGIPKGNVPHYASKVADKYDYVLHGHTHQQYDLDASRWTHDVHFVNPGSLGYDHTYTVIETDDWSITHKSVEDTSDEVREHLKNVLPPEAPSVERWL
jgi:Predicted phosphoesterase